MFKYTSSCAPNSIQYLAASVCCHLRKTLAGIVQKGKSLSVQS